MTETSTLESFLAKKTAIISHLSAQLADKAIELAIVRADLAEAEERYELAFGLYCSLRRSCGKMPVASGTTF
jgi:hypothetical protein